MLGKLCRKLIDWRRDSGNNFNFKIKTSEPVNAYGSPVWVRRTRERHFFRLHNDGKLVFRVGVKCRYIDNIVKGTSRGRKGSLEVIKCELYLSGEIGLRCAIAAAADLARNK